MKRKIVGSYIVVAALLMLGFGDFAESTPDPKKTKYNVVQISDHEGVVSFTILTSEELKAKPKELKKVYTEAVKVYKADKKANKGKTELKKPLKPKLKKLKGGLSSEETAEKYRKAYEEKWQKALEKKKAKKAKKQKSPK
jgi:hypothetical protein